MTKIREEQRMSKERQASGAGSLNGGGGGGTGGGSNKDENNSGDQNQSQQETQDTVKSTSPLVESTTAGATNAAGNGGGVGEGEEDVDNGDGEISPNAVPVIPLQNQPQHQQESQQEPQQESTPGASTPMGMGMVGDINISGLPNIDIVDHDEMVVDQEGGIVDIKRELIIIKKVEVKICISCVLISFFIYYFFLSEDDGDAADDLLDLDAVELMLRAAEGSTPQPDMQVGTPR